MTPNDDVGVCAPAALRCLFSIPRVIPGGYTVLLVSLLVFLHRRVN